MSKNDYGAELSECAKIAMDAGRFYRYDIPLRVWLAGQALAGIHKADLEYVSGTPRAEVASNIAQACCELADAVLAECAKTPAVQDETEPVEVPSPLSVSTERNRLLAAIIWALGTGGEFRSRGNGEGPYFWRTELQRRAGLKWDDEKYVMEVPCDGRGNAHGWCPKCGYGVAENLPCKGKVTP